MSILSSLNSNVNISKESNAIVLFDVMYELLYSVIRHRRDEMLHLISLFFSSISCLLDCFVSKGSKFGDRLFKQLAVEPFALIYPLRPTHAKQLTRLLVQMSQKGLTSENQKVYSTKAFAKYAPFLVLRLLSIQSASKSNLGDEWQLCCFACLDSCDDHGRSMILASLNGPMTPLRAIFKSLVSDWEKQHRYQGKA
jgi:hypothetical protein